MTLPLAAPTRPMPESSGGSLYPLLSRCSAGPAVWPTTHMPPQAAPATVDPFRRVVASMSALNEVGEDEDTRPAVGRDREPFDARLPRAGTCTP